MTAYYASLIKSISCAAVFAALFSFTALAETAEKNTSANSDGATSAYDDINPSLRRRVTTQVPIPEVTWENCTDPDVFDDVFYQILNTPGSALNQSTNLSRLEEFENKCHALKKERRLEEIKQANAARAARAETAQKAQNNQKTRKAQ